jgi:hypothetical protein
LRDKTFRVSLVDQWELGGGTEAELFQLGQRLVRLLPDVPELAVSALSGGDVLGGHRGAGQSQKRQGAARRALQRQLERFHRFAGPTHIHQHLTDLLVTGFTGTGGRIRNGQPGFDDVRPGGRGRMASFAPACAIRSAALSCWAITCGTRG